MLNFLNGGFSLMKQIILITDGCSNMGMDPVVAAAHALAEDIVVNVIGVVDQGEIGDRGTLEINEIAAAGGGMSRIISSKLLTQTVQMMTRQTVTRTIQQLVKKELKDITGHSKIEDLPLDQRGQVVRVIDDLSETSSLQVALLVDTSASMKPKLQAVEEAIQDLMLSLQARQGTSEISIFHFPGSQSGIDIEMRTNWTKDLAKLGKLFYKLNMKGTTPTGPALMEVIHFFGTGHMYSDRSPFPISEHETTNRSLDRHRMM
jgi:Ca-activated chloride channel family protein